MRYNLSRLKFLDIPLLGVLLTTSLAFCVYFFDFTIDDAYITLRYASHLASGQGVRWNLGADPVEGYTSTLWLLVGAVPHTIGIPPVLFVKIMGVVSLLLVIVGVYLIGRQMGVDRWWIIPIVAILALNPAIALLAIQGMETTTAMAFVLLSAITTLRLSQAYKRSWVFVLYITLFLGLLTRPDLVAYAGGLLAGLALVTYRRDGKKTTARLTGWGVVLLLTPGVAFIAIRTAYFGYPLPNSFYIKEGGGLISIAGAISTVEFIALVVAPLLIATLALTFKPTDTHKPVSFSQSAPLLGGIVAFLPLWAFINPTQGYLWRFQSPILPAFLLLLFVLLRRVKFPDVKSLRASVPLSSGIDERTIRTAGLVLLVVLLTLYPVQFMNDTLQAESIRRSDDRVQMGQALEPLSGEGYRMFVSESGAVPYYSKWNAIDWLGLNSEEIAHNGRTLSYMREYNPDLIMTIVPATQSPLKGRPSLKRLIQTNNYRLAAVVQKSGSPGTYHAYYVDANSSGYQDIVCAVQGVDAIEYKDIASYSSFWNISPVQPMCANQ